MQGESKGNPSQILQEFNGNPLGIIRKTSRMQRESIGNPSESTENPQGILKKSIGNPLGIHMNFIRNPWEIQRKSTGPP